MESGRASSCFSHRKPRQGTVLQPQTPRMQDCEQGTVECTWAFGKPQPCERKDGRKDRETLELGQVHRANHFEISNIGVERLGLPTSGSMWQVDINQRASRVDLGYVNV
jgi:hypothetical protein